MKTKLEVTAKKKAGSHLFDLKEQPVLLETIGRAALNRPGPCDGLLTVARRGEETGFDPAPNVEPFRQETAGGWKGGGGLCFKGEHGGGGELQGGAVTRVCLLRLKVESWVAVRTWAAAPSRSALYTVCTPSLASRAEAAPT